MLMPNDWVRIESAEYRIVEASGERRDYIGERGWIVNAVNGGLELFLCLPIMNGRLNSTILHMVLMGDGAVLHASAGALRKLE
jgi:hypothetical protein